MYVFDFAEQERCHCFTEYTWAGGCLLFLAVAMSICVTVFICKARGNVYIVFDQDYCRWTLVAVLSHRYVFNIIYRDTVVLTQTLMIIRIQRRLPSSDTIRVLKLFTW